MFDTISNRKWDLTDAAIRRIDQRIRDLRRSDNNETDDDKEWYLDPMGLLLEAMRPKNYANVRDSAEQLLQIWMREGDQNWLCAACFKAYADDRREARNAGRNLMNGIRQMGRLKL